MRLAGLAALLIAAACGGSAAEPVRLVGAPVALNPSDPAQTRVGALSYVGGLRLTAPGTTLFGGLSGLETTGPETLSDLALTAVSDQGERFTFHVDAERGLALGRGGRLTTARLTEGGRPLGAKADADAEAVARLDDGALLVSFERRHRIIRYAPDGRDRPFGAPAVTLPENSGYEALALLPLSGRKVLAVGAEDGRIWFCDVDAGRDCNLFLKGTPGFGYSLTGLDHLPGTADLVATYRYFDPVQGMRAVIAWISTGVAGGGPRPRIVPLARLAPPLTVDNMEGIAAVPLPGRGWRLFVLSDDNFSAEQRTLLLAFDWLTGQPKTEPPR